MNGRMHKRIEKLIYECTTVDYDVQADCDDSYMVQPHENFDKEKFAELIVQKCAQRCEKLALKYHVEGAFACAEDLRKYFGVK